MPSNKLFGLGILTILGYGAIAGLGDQRELPVAFQIIFWLVFVIYLIGVRIAWRTRTDDKRSLAVILLVAVIIRMMMVVCSPTLSDDVYRYAWEGKIQTAGLNPYNHTPVDASLKSLWNDPLYKQLCPRYTLQAAVYPPAAEAVFWLGALPGIAPVWLIKLLLGLADIGSLWLLVLILRRLKLNPLRAVIYAWSPLAVLEISQSGHIDGLAILFVLAAVLAVLRGKDVLGGVFGALAFAAKITPAVMLPALYRKKDWRFPLAFILTLAVTCLPYLSAAETWFGLKTQAGNQPYFNSGIKGAIEAIIGRSIGLNNVYDAAAIVALAVGALVVWLRQDGSDKATMDGLFLMAALFLVVTPYLPQWYVLLIIPFLAWRPSPAFLWLSGGVMLMYVIYMKNGAGLNWPGQIEYGVFFLLLIGEAINHTWQRVRKFDTSVAGLIG